MSIREKYVRISLTHESEFSDEKVLLNITLQRIARSRIKIACNSPEKKRNFYYY